MILTTSAGRALTKFGLSYSPLYIEERLTYPMTADISHLVIREMSQPTVRTVQVTNTGNTPVLLREGVLLKGGHQNRAVERPVVVLPGRTVEVQTVCVEQRRWSGGERFETVGDTMAPLPVRGTLHRSVRGGSTSAGRGATRADQSAVWADVATLLGHLEPMPETGVTWGPPPRLVNPRGVPMGRPPVVTGTGDLLGPLGRLHERHAKKLNEVINRGPLPGQCGVAVSRGGSVLSIDLFGCPGLLRDEWARIIRGSIASADQSGSDVTSTDAVLAMLRRMEKSARLPINEEDDVALGQFADPSVNGTVLTIGNQLVVASATPAS